MSRTGSLVVIDARGYFTRGGVGRYTRNLVDHLLSEPQNELAFRLLISNRHRPDEIAVAPEVDAEVRCSRATWQEPEEEAKFLEEEVAGADLFHSLTGHWVPEGVPAVSSIQDLTPLVWPTLVSDHIRLLFRTVCSGLPRAVRILAASHNTARDLSRLLDVDPARVETVHHGVDSRFRPQLPDSRLLASAGVQPDGYLLTVGATAPHKNLVRLLRAYGRAALSTPLLIAGAGDFGADVARAAAERLGLADRVRIVPCPEDDALIRLYSSCRGFLYPSLYEGFGLPVLEAMACGAPVLCSNTSSLPEIAGDEALFTDPEDDDAMAAAIRRLDTDAALRAQLRAAGPRRARLFSWERAVGQIVDVYRRALQEAA